jgi:preprotein translocase subunit SecA
MLKTIARYFFGTVNERKLREIQIVVDIINALEPTLSKLSNDELKKQTNKLREAIRAGRSLDDLLPEAFATVREASKRVFGMRHFDTQLIGGIVLHQGTIAEMKTGEGKTLAAPLAVYLNALEGKGVHIVTINDYLAERDSKSMGTLFEFLGLSVGCITNNIDEEKRKTAYEADITYGTNNEFGFDFLRDNMKYSLEEMVQRSFNFAVIDEVDSILIDEARTPLIISGPTEDNSDLYVEIDRLILKLKDESFEIDEKSKSVTLTEDGTTEVENLLIEARLLQENASMYDFINVHLVHHVNQALKAHKLFKVDVDYMIKDGQLMIIDEFTGRALEGRRYSEGLHQALEAKEGVPIQNENQTLASITFQNYFRLYPKLSGMTGTAMTEAAEFLDIYKLDVIAIPTHQTMIRIDEDDEIYRTGKEKYDAIVKVIEEAHKNKQPVLVGTVSIEKSEYISSLLTKVGVKHNVLNAKHHDKEAAIIAQAGRPAAVTIATNMAGRGTDIMLGGNQQLMITEATSKLSGVKKESKIKEIIAQVEKDKELVKNAGGLLVIGSERHESRRIDNQLRGRSGRQGDQGKSKFYLSLEDDLMRIFASEKISGILQKLGLDDGEAIHHPMISRALEKAQQKVEGRNFEIRKTLLKFDDVSNDQRKVIYEQRHEILSSADILADVKDIIFHINSEIVSKYIPEKSYPEQWDMEGMTTEIFRIYGIQLDLKKWVEIEGVSEEKVLELLQTEVDKLFVEKEEKYSAEVLRNVEKRFLLFTLDQLWKDHLYSLDHLKQGINLRAYGQKDPLNEYKREAFTLFEHMLEQMRELFILRLAHAEIKFHGDEDGANLYHPKQKMFESRQDPALQSQEAPNQPILVARNYVEPEDRDAKDPDTWGKVRRNEACPCNSGKKYKHCHGQM